MRSVYPPLFYKSCNTVRPICQPHNKRNVRTSHPQVSDYTVYNLLPFFIDVSVALANKYRLSNLQTFTNERGTEKSKFFSRIEKVPLSFKKA